MSEGYLAFDLGAESCRTIVGVLADGRISLEEVHRYPHEILELPSGLHWDITGLWQAILKGLKEAGRWARQHRVDLRSVGVDTWGIDWALIGKSGEVIGLPHAYRDPRNDRAFEEVVGKLGKEEIYNATGNQLLSLNTLYSLYAHCKESPECINSAERLVFMPDLFHYWLSGKLSVEATVASTSQMIDCKTGSWAKHILNQLGIPTRLLGELTPPCTPLGTLLPHVAEAAGISNEIQVVVPASHDTASAVASVPAAEDSKWCYLSSGTSSLLGAEISEICVTPESQTAEFTNELGVEGRVRFLKNVTGLWIVQECRRDLIQQGHNYDYARLTEFASKAEPFRTLLNLSEPALRTPGVITKKIRDYATKTGQPVPESPGQIVRACLESLALKYRSTMTSLEHVLNQEFNVLHVVGGGGQNSLLNQMTADATGKQVRVGPFEATAYGNVLTQALALGSVSSLNELRRIVTHSCELQDFKPSSVNEWEKAERRLVKLL